MLSNGFKILEVQVNLHNKYMYLEPQLEAQTYIYDTISPTIASETSWHDIRYMYLSEVGVVLWASSIHTCCSAI